MAKLAYVLSPVNLDRALFLDTLECMADDGLLSRSQVRTLATLSVHRLPGEVDMQQRTPKGAITVTFGGDVFNVTRTGKAHATTA